MKTYRKARTFKKYSNDDKIALEKCREKWEELKRELGNSYVQLRSCNQDISKYLIVDGTQHELSYYGVPEDSYRLSDHWNWYSNWKKCADDEFVQCFSKDLPGPNCRPSVGKASYPIFAISICRFHDGAYDVIFGDKYVKETNEWIWVE